MQYITSGEGHGPQLTTVVTGVPSGLKVAPELINSDLRRYQKSYDGSAPTATHEFVQILSGMRFGKTLGSPVTFSIPNQEWESWASHMAPIGNPPSNLIRSVVPRPGHGDLVGTLKNDTDDCNNITERLCDRELMMRVAAGAIAKEFLAEVGVEVFSYVYRIGSAIWEEENPFEQAAHYSISDIELSSVRCPHQGATEKMQKMIEVARLQGETLGGQLRVVATGLLVGLGDYAQASRHLSGKLAQELFSIPSVTAVEVGLGVQASKEYGSKTHDALIQSPQHGFSRATNYAGGIEDGMTTGMPLVMSVSVAPPTSLQNPLASVDIDTMEVASAQETAQCVCAVPSRAVVAEAVVAFVLADAYLQKFGSDNMTDIKAHVKQYRERIRTASR